MRDSIEKPGQAGTFLRIGDRCYKAANQTGCGRVKRVNLIDYFNLAEALASAKSVTVPQTNKGGTIWVGTYSLPAQMKAFVADDNGFSTSKHVASQLGEAVDEWFSANLMDGNSPSAFKKDVLDMDFHNWQYGIIATKVDAFRSVFEAECRDVDVYTVGQISIYKTSALVSNGHGVLPPETRENVPSEALKEFDDAGRCLAFDLPTACGFHALRALELVMDDYLNAFGVVTEKMKSWNDYIVAAKNLSDSTTAPKKPSPKVAAMLDRMRELDRNPLMHPRDTLDEVSANMLFNLCAITATEMVKDKGRQALVPMIADNTEKPPKKGKDAA